MRKKCSSDRDRILKFFEIIRTMHDPLHTQAKGGNEGNSKNEYFGRHLWLKLVPLMIQTRQNSTSTTKIQISIFTIPISIVPSSSYRTQILIGNYLQKYNLRSELLTEMSISLF